MSDDKKLEVFPWQNPETPEEIQQSRHASIRCPNCGFSGHVNDEIERLRAYCRDYAEMTGIILNVPAEQREAFMEALSKQ